MFLIIILGVAAVAYIYTRSLQKAVPPTITEKPNSWSGVVPGETTIDEIYQRLGAPISSSESATGTMLSYPSSNKYWTNDVDTSQNKVTFIKERVFAPAEISLKKRINDLGGNPITLFGPEFHSGINLYAFPSVGVALYGNQSQDTTYEVWRFPPTTLQGLLALPEAKDFSTTISRPAGSL